MTTAQPGPHGALEDTSFSTPGERELAGRGSIERARAIKRQVMRELLLSHTLRSESDERIRAAILSARQSLETEREQVRSPGRKGRRSVREFRLTSEQRAQLCEPRQGPALGWELEALERWSQLAGRQEYPAPPQGATSSQRQVRQFLVLRKAQMGHCKKILSIYEENPRSLWPLLNLVRRFYAIDLSADAAQKNVDELSAEIRSLRRQIAGLQQLCETVREVRNVRNLSDHRAQRIVDRCLARAFPSPKGDLNEGRRDRTQGQVSAAADCEGPVFHQN